MVGSIACCFMEVMSSENQQISGLYNLYFGKVDGLKHFQLGVNQILDLISSKLSDAPFRSNVSQQI